MRDIGFWSMGVPACMHMGMFKCFLLRGKYIQYWGFDSFWLTVMALLHSPQQEMSAQYKGFTVVPPHPQPQGFLVDYVSLYGCVLWEDDYFRIPQARPRVGNFSQNHHHFHTSHCRKGALFNIHRYHDPNRRVFDKFDLSKCIYLSKSLSIQILPTLDFEGWKVRTPLVPSLSASIWCTVYTPGP